VASIAAVLACYEPDLIREATDPRTGISSTEKFMSFMPNSGELKAFCDALAQRRRRMGEYAAMPRGPGARANVFCSASNGRYQGLCERAVNPTSNALDFRYDVERGGIWVNQNWL
jgi:hypothetical protein